MGDLIEFVVSDSREKLDHNKSCRHSERSPSRCSAADLPYLRDSKGVCDLFREFFEDKHRDDCFEVWSGGFVK